ncbi:MAG: cyclopropane-fatty-acyl-phospholipid synthase family protein [Methylovulum sp.]|jgi:cyclopropane-fatty-acyl-phospholipid synthase|nr:cyclopropane-fatty-acyl-phospholipid synthase family protein [Methylovulum sp.]
MIDQKKVNKTKQLIIKLIENGKVPDPLIRLAIRQLLRERLSKIPLSNPEICSAYVSQFLSEMTVAPVAITPEKANQQHYEVPAAFFELVLGQRRKYSSCYWPDGIKTLDNAEIESLAKTCERASLLDGQEILELGCGWGSLSLWMAEQYPNSRIKAVSNSHSQRLYIMDKAAEKGYSNLDVITRDMNVFDTNARFDRIVSVEMFEHMRNWQLLFGRVSEWLKPGGLFFMHVFCNRSLPYEFVVQNESDWMGRHFFSGGMMPSYHLPLYFQDKLKLTRQWSWSGKHYEDTANAWLANMDSQKQQIWPILVETYGSDQALTWWVRWRVFFMSCAELFGYDHGSEWFVGHYCFERPY